MTKRTLAITQRVGQFAGYCVQYKLLLYSLQDQRRGVGFPLGYAKRTPTAQASWGFGGLLTQTKNIFRSSEMPFPMFTKGDLHIKTKTQRTLTIQQLSCLSFGATDISYNVATGIGSDSDSDNNNDNNNNKNNKLILPKFNY